MIRRPPRSTRTDTLFPYTTLFRSHPWTSYLVIPIFALANAGIPLSADSIGDAVSSRVTLGVVLGLVVGKLVGISGITWLAVRLGIGRLPVGVAWRQVGGMASVAGIGLPVRWEERRVGTECVSTCSFGGARVH